MKHPVPVFGRVREGTFDAKASSRKIISIPYRNYFQPVFYFSAIQMPGDYAIM